MKQELRNKHKGSALNKYNASLIHALEGIKYACIYEHNMKIIIPFIVLVTICGFILKISIFEWLFCIAMFGAVSASELINSSIEALVDLNTLEYNELAKIAKDTASSATLILSITSLIGGLIIFIPKIVGLF